MQRDSPLTNRSCAIGSIKGNIGHANCAAGITGVIKTIMALKKAELVPTAHFSKLNDKLLDFIDTEGSPFYVHKGHHPWEVSNPETQLPRRAGVSSFGIGGTNAHVILEESTQPTTAPTSASFVRPKHIVTISAKTSVSLRANLNNLALYLRDCNTASIPSIAKTLHTSREHHKLRSFVVASSDNEFTATSLQQDITTTRVKDGATVAFMFSGQGSQHASMARDLYDSTVDGGLFRTEFDKVSDVISSFLARDIRSELLQATDDTIQSPVLTQCGLFAVEYALARSLQYLGLEPIAVAGHSVGEYAAAAIAKAITLEDAARLVCARSQATEQLTGQGVPLGGMISVVGDQHEISAWVARHEDVWIAVENAPNQLVLSVAQDHLDTSLEALKEQGFTCQRVPVSHPFHSPLMTPVADAIAVCGEHMKIDQPRTPMVSNLSGGWFSGESEPKTYWSEHLLQPVQWRQNIATLMKWSPDILLEVGPGHTLTSFAAKCMTDIDGNRPQLINSLPSHNSEKSTDDAWCEMLGKLWSNGIDIDWDRYHQNETAEDKAPLKHCLLPTYEFEKTRYWTKPEASIYVQQDGAQITAPVRLVQENIAERPTSSNTVNMLITFDQKSTPSAFLFCFVYAGGSSQYFEELSRYAPSWLSVCAVELPGHLYRSEEPLGTTVTTDQILLCDIGEAIRRKAADKPVFLCGMSFGVTIISALVDDILSDFDTSGQLKGIVVAGRCRADETIINDPLNIRSFLMESAEVTQSEIWQQTFLPIIEADLKCDARLSRRVKRMNDAFNAPIQVHCGLDDDSFDLIMAKRWSSVSRNKDFILHGYSGDHSFMIQEKTRIFSSIIDFVTRQLPIEKTKTSPILETTWVPVIIPMPNDKSAVQWYKTTRNTWDSIAEQVIVSLRKPNTGVTIEVATELTDDIVQDIFCVQKFLQTLDQASVRGFLTLCVPWSPVGRAMAAMFRTFQAEQGLVQISTVHFDRFESALEMDSLKEGTLQFMNTSQDAKQWRFQGGQLLEERLFLSNSIDLLPPPDLGEAHPNACYVVTGATGGLGRELVQWLTTQGVDASNIFVISRSGNVQFDAAVNVIESELSDIKRIDKSIPTDREICGVFHLAGKLEDALLVNQTKVHLDTVFAPKLALEMLYTWAAQRHANWVIAYSSTSSIFHTPGQSNYAAANAWVDGYTEQLSGTHTTKLCSVNWGTWDEIGMSARNKRAMDIARQEGETPLQFKEAMQSLSNIITHIEQNQALSYRYVICDIDWPHSTWSNSALAKDLIGIQPISLKPQALEVPDEKPDKVAGAENRIKTFLFKFLHEWDEQASLIDLGLDSLDFARIKSAFTKEFDTDISLSEIARPDQTLGHLYQTMEGLSQ